MFIRYDYFSLLHVSYVFYILVWVVFLVRYCVQTICLPYVNILKENKDDVLDLNVKIAFNDVAF